MKKYIAYAKCGFIDSFAYRSSFISSVLANFINIIILHFLWRSIFSFSTTINGFTWNQMQQYILISFVCNSAFSYTFESQLSKRIIRGEIVLDFVKPIHYREMLLSRLIGSSICEYLLSFLFALCFLLISKTVLTLKPEIFICFLFSMTFSLLTKFSIQFCFSMLCFYTDNYYGVTKAREIITNFFSGSLIPLMLFPEAVRNILECLPFSSIVYIPSSIFIGIYDMPAIIYRLLFQAVWFIILWLLCGFLWKQTSKRVSVYGG